MKDDLVPPQQVDITYETEEPVLYEVADGVAWITMNRPQFNNAQNGQMTYALDDAFNRAVADDAVRCIVLAGNGKHFSAGHDMKELTARRSDADRGRGYFAEIMNACSAMMQAIVQLPKPVAIKALA